jgi:soluble lytic murein transglycosylase-like protein
MASVAFAPSAMHNAIGTAESNKRDYTASGAPVTSPKGARFAMQVMPSTARDPGYGLRPANVNDPADMNRLGREYADKMAELFGGDPAKTAAAYNAGPGRLGKALRRNGNNWLGAMPAETRAYVPRVLRNLRK